MIQYYKIAGLIVQMDTFGRNLEQAKPYLTAEGKPDIVIQTNPVDMQKIESHLSLEDCEYILSGWEFYRKLIAFDGFMLHSSAVVVDGRAYLFSATSGTGKSTHTSLWLKKFGDKAYILNDDKPALRLENGVWYAYGTPWSGKYDISTNTRIPVAGICFITRSKTNKIYPFNGSKAVFAFLEQTVRPADMQSRTTIMNLLQEMMSGVPIWKLECNMEPEAADVAYDAMSRKVIEPWRETYEENR